MVTCLYNHLLTMRCKHYGSSWRIVPVEIDTDWFCIKRLFFFDGGGLGWWNISCKFRKWHRHASVGRFTAVLFVWWSSSHRQAITRSREQIFIESRTCDGAERTLSLYFTARAVCPPSLTVPGSSIRVLPYLAFFCQKGEVKEITVSA